MKMGNINKAYLEPTERIEEDRETNSQFNNKPVKTKKSFFDKHPGKIESTESETIWREVNLFWPETIAIVGSAVAGIILIFVIRYMSLTSLEMIKDMLTDQAYLEVAGLINNMNTIFVGVAAIPFLVMIGFYAYRFFVFTPRKNKYLVARVKRTGAVRLSIDKIVANELPFDNSGIANKMTINNPRKHWLENLGKPFVVLFEGDDCNADLNAMAGNVSSKAKEINTINENAIAFGRRIEKYIQEEKDNLFKNPMFYMMLAMLAILIIVGFLVLKQPEQIQSILAGAS